MPYLLPSDPNANELACALVFYPDRTEYRRALFGQLSELSDVWTWEGSEDDQAIARQVWLSAELETLGCSVAFCDDLLATLQEIRDKPCCDPFIPGGGGDLVALDETELPPNDVDISGGAYPDGTTTANGAAVALCGLGEHFADNIGALVDNVEFVVNTTSGALAIATMIVIAWGNLIGMGIAAIITAGGAVTLFDIFGINDELQDLAELIRGGDHVTQADQTKTELAGIRDDIRDAIGCANSADEAATALAALFDANITSLLYRVPLKLAHSKGIMRFVFNNRPAGVTNSAECPCTVPDFLASTFTLVNGNFWAWSGAAYVDHNWGGGAYKGFLSDPIRCKGGSDDRLTFAVSQAVGGTPRQNMSITIDLVGVTDNVLVQTFQGTGTAVHNQTHAPGEFPMNFSGIDGIRLEAPQLDHDVEPDRYALLTVTAVS